MMKQRPRLPCELHTCAGKPELAEAGSELPKNCRRNSYIQTNNKYIIYWAQTNFYKYLNTVRELVIQSP